MTVEVTLQVLAKLMRDESEDQITRDLGVSLQEVADLRSMASSAGLPLTPKLAAVKRAKSQLVELVMSDDMGLFKRVRSTSHCGADYEIGDRFCSKCGQRLEFPSVLETLIAHLEKRLKSSPNEKTQRELNSWLDALEQIDSVARLVDDTRAAVEETEEVRERHIPYGQCGTRLRNVLMSAGIQYFTEIEVLGKSRVMELRNFGETSLEELTKLMRDNGRSDEWLDR